MSTTDRERQAVAPKPPTIGSAQADGIVVVEIGHDRKKYYLHKALVVFHSEYFRKALQGPWKEAEEGLVRLDDVEPAEFNVFVHWLYNLQLPEKHSYQAWNRIFENDELPVMDLFLLRIRAYALDDRLLAPTFRRAVNSVIVSDWHAEVRDAVTLALTYQWAFANIPADRLVLQFLVNDFCDFWHERRDADNVGMKGFPHAFTLRVVRRYSQLVQLSVKKPVKTHCYIEHSSKKEQDDCETELHMTYDAEKDFGNFTTDSSYDP
ncbi:hypothetical protein N0V95_009494 [Ascochyta clinopodiicola]|nr:hypothetical protein N0V95_009494 [Ascochyta clinopodiicola]